MYGGQDISYIDILDDSKQMVKEYFDGRGAINSDHEYERAIGLGESILTKKDGQETHASTTTTKFLRKCVSNSGHFVKSHKHTVTTNAETGIKALNSNGHGRRQKFNYSPAQNFDQCDFNTAMRCWTESTGKKVLA